MKKLVPKTRYSSTCQVFDSIEVERYYLNVLAPPYYYGCLLIARQIL